jgi:hypothetical protein
LQADSLFESLVMTTSQQRRMEEEDIEMEVHKAFRRRHVSLVHPDRLGNVNDRRNEEGGVTQEADCDQALLSCLPEEKCAACFGYLYGEDVDWGTVTPETSCDDVLGFLAKKNYCQDMHTDQGAKDAFCNAFNVS